ncbi:hypothetical protein M3J09_009052 [Ascochyta lentis]
MPLYGKTAWGETNTDVAFRFVQWARNIFLNTPSVLSAVGLSRLNDVGLCSAILAIMFVKARSSIDL